MLRQLLRQLLILGASLPGVACGPGHAGASDESFVCDRQGPIRLMTAEPSQTLRWERVPEGLLVEVSQSFARARTVVVDACADDPRVLEPWSDASDNAASFGFVEPWLLHCGEGGRIDVFELGDTVTSHRLFERSPGCRVHRLGGGLATVDPETHDLVFVADPSDASSSPRALAHDVVAWGKGGCRRGEFEGCSPISDDVRTLGFGDHILAPHEGDRREDALIGHAFSIVDLAGAVEPSHAAPARVRNMAAFADGRHAVLAGYVSNSEAPYLESLSGIYDAKRRSFALLGWSGGFTVVDPWVSDALTLAAPHELELLHVGTGVRHHVPTPDHWVLSAASDTTIFLSVEERARGIPARVRGYAEDVATGSREPLFMLEDSLHANLLVDRSAELVFVLESHEVIDWTGGPGIVAEQVHAAEFRRREDMVALSFAFDRRLGNAVVFFDRGANAAWELIADGGVEIIDRRDDGGVTIVYAEAGELWRRDL